MSNYPDNFTGTPYDGPDDNSITDYTAEKMAKKIAAEFVEQLSNRVTFETSLPASSLKAMDFTEELTRFIRDQIIDAASYEGRFTV